MRGELIGRYRYFGTKNMPTLGNGAVEAASSEVVFTLTEAASFLRVKRDILDEMAARGAVPARKIGNEWRFLKAALIEWLYGDPCIPIGTGSSNPPRGSKQAVRKHFGIFHQDTDLDERIADLAAQRKPEVVEGKP